MRLINEIFNLLGRERAFDTMSKNGISISSKHTCIQVPHGNLDVCRLQDGIEDGGADVRGRGPGTEKSAKPLFGSSEGLTYHWRWTG